MENAVRTSKELLAEAEMRQERERSVQLDGQEFRLLLANEFEGDSCTKVSEQFKDQCRRMFTNPDYIEGLIKGRGLVPRWAFDFYMKNYYDSRKVVREQLAHSDVLSDINTNLHTAVVFELDKMGNVKKDKKGNPIRQENKAEFPAYSLDELSDMDDDMLVMPCRFYGIRETMPADAKRKAIYAAQSGEAKEDDVQQHSGERESVPGSRE